MSGYLKWVKTLNKEDLYTFNGIELEAMIKELVGEELDKNPEEIKPLYMNKSCLINQIFTYNEWTMRWMIPTIILNKHSRSGASELYS